MGIENTRRLVNQIVELAAAGKFKIVTVMVVKIKIQKFKDTVHLPGKNLNVIRAGTKAEKDVVQVVILVVGGLVEQYAKGLNTKIVMGEMSFVLPD